MKKLLFILMMFALALPCAFAQQGQREVIVYFKDGQVQKGLLSRLPGNERFSLYTAEGRVITFQAAQVKDLTYGDGTRPGTNKRQPSTARPVNPQRQQATPRQTAPRQQVAPRQEQRSTAPRQSQQNRQPVRVDENGRAINQPRQQNQARRQQQARSREEDEELNGDDLLLAPSSRRTETRKPAQTRQAAKAAPAPEEASATGPRGFLEFGYSIGMGKVPNKYGRMEITFSYGAQITPSFFAGFGLGVQLFGDTVFSKYTQDSNGLLTPIPVPMALGDSSSTYTKMSIPIFVDLRYDFTRGSVVPFVGLKLGYSIAIQTTNSFSINESGNQSIRKETKAAGQGLYLVPSFGVKFRLTRSMAFHLALAYTAQMHSYSYIGPSSSGGATALFKKTQPMSAFTLRAGLEF
jgi:hypothetical protein